MNQNSKHPFLFKAMLSFFSVWLAWFSIYNVSILYKIFSDKGLQDYNFWLFWPAFMSGLSWLFVFLPLVSIHKFQKFYANRILFPIFAAVMGMILLRLLLMPFIGFDAATIYPEDKIREKFFLMLYVYAACIGLLTGISFTQLLNLVHKGIATKKITVWLMAILSGVMALYFHVIPYFFPVTAYRYLGGKFQDQSLYYILSQVKEGDSIETLRHQVPKFFPGDRNCQGAFAGGNPQFHFSVKYKDCKVIQIRLNKVE